MTQETVDAIATAIAQENLDQAGLFRENAMFKHGLQGAVRNTVKGIVGKADDSTTTGPIAPPGTTDKIGESTGATATRRGVLGTLAKLGLAAAGLGGATAAGIAIDRFLRRPNTNNNNGTGTTGGDLLDHLVEKGLNRG